MDTNDEQVTRDERGRWITAPSNGAPQFTSANARMNAQKRWRKTERAIADAIMDEIGSVMPNPAKTPRAALAHIAAKQAVTLMESEHPRMDDLEKLGQLMGEVPRTVELRAQAANTAGDVLDSLRALLHEMAGAARELAIPSQIHETIDGDTVDAT